MIARVLAVLLLACSVSTAQPDQQIEQIKKTSVLVESLKGFGSGVVFVNHDKTFIWTNAHVVLPNRWSKTAVDPTNGLMRTYFGHTDPKVITEVYKDGDKVGENVRYAKTIRFSRVKDLALLVLYEKNAGMSSTKFATDPLNDGASIIHIGSPLGRIGFNSVLPGTLVRANRVFEEQKMDHVAVPGFFGSSGGGVYTKSDGVCHGLITQFLGGIGNQLTQGNFMAVTARSIRVYAKDVNVKFAIDDTVTVPNDRELFAQQVEYEPFDPPPAETKK